MKRKDLREKRLKQVIPQHLQRLTKRQVAKLARFLDPCCCTVNPCEVAPVVTASILSDTDGIPTGFDDSTNACTTSCFAYEILVNSTVTYTGISFPDGPTAFADYSTELGNITLVSGDIVDVNLYGVCTDPCPAAISDFTLKDTTQFTEPLITVGLIDGDGDSTGFCNAGTLDYSNFDLIDISAYGGSSALMVTSDADIIAAFAGVGINGVTISNCQITFPAGYTGTTSDVEVDTSVPADPCTGTPTVSYSGSAFYVNGSNGTDPHVAYADTAAVTAGYTVDWGDGNIDTFAPGVGPTNSPHTYAPSTPPNNVIVTLTYVDANGNTVVLKGRQGTNDINPNTVLDEYDVASISVGTGRGASVTLDTTNCPSSAQICFAGTCQIHIGNGTSGVFTPITQRLEIRLNGVIQGSPIIIPATSNVIPPVCLDSSGFIVGHNQLDVQIFNDTTNEFIGQSVGWITWTP